MMYLTIPHGRGGVERGEPDPEIDQQSITLRIWTMYLTIPHGRGGEGVWKGGSQILRLISKALY